jgi:hypothetical protein
MGHVSRSNGISDSSSSFSHSFGAGLDYRLSNRLAFRQQLSWIKTSFYSKSQNDARFSSGITVRF